MRTARTIVFMVMESALHAGLVTTNHATRLRVRSGSTRAKQALTAKQIEALVAALPCRYQALALVLAYGDLRPAEALGMRRRHLDDPGRLLVEGGLTETRGKLIEPRRPRLTGCGSFPCRRRSPASSRRNGDQCPERSRVPHLHD